jgi:hypothetical protein
MRHSALYYLSGLVAGIAFTVTMFMLIPSAIEDGPKPPAPFEEPIVWTFLPYSNIEILEFDVPSA